MADLVDVIEGQKLAVIEYVARALAVYRYEDGADTQRLDREEWVDLNWRDFAGEAQTAIDACLTYAASSRPGPVGA